MQLHGNLKLHHLRQLWRFPATFKGKTADGLLAFDYELYGNRAITGGESGGIVVDSRTGKIVGVLTLAGERGNQVAEAVPIENLADFVSKALPFLAARIFPSRQFVSPVRADFYSKFVPARIEALQHRPVEPPEVTKLRNKAELLADSMRNYIAVQTFAWGSGNNEPAAEKWYEIQVIDGLQRYRTYPDGKREFTRPHFPRLTDWVLGSDEWSELPKMVGTEYQLKIRQAPDVVLKGQSMRVFQYYASVEDNLCSYENVVDYGLFTVGKPISVACYGEVWADKDTNIARMSEHLDLSGNGKIHSGWQDCQIVLTYGWLEEENEPPRLVPLTEFAQARYRKRIYWSRSYFTDYRVFRATARIAKN
jgi:hypothetical protein